MEEDRGSENHLGNHSIILRVKKYIGNLNEADENRKEDYET